MTAEQFINDYYKKKHPALYRLRKATGISLDEVKEILEAYIQETSKPAPVDRGWACEDSPTGYCDYTQEDGSFDEDYCRYCGQPDERK